MSDINECGRCAYGTECLCDHYAAWDLPTSPTPREAAVGLRASGFLEGFARGGRDALQRAWRDCCPDCKTKVETIAKDYDPEREAS